MSKLLCSAESSRIGSRTKRDLQTCGTSVTVPSSHEQPLEIHEWTDDLIAEEDYIPLPPRPQNRTSAKAGKRPKKSKNRRLATMDDSTWYRGFWIRFAAYLIDSLVLSFLWMPISLMLHLLQALAPVEDELR